jgi:outer membrane receptor protein involved in Fe transport
MKVQLPARAAQAVAGHAFVYLAVAAALPCAAHAQENTLDEITVTAQKREESALEVPMTVDVFTARDIEETGALNLQDIQDFIPGFEVGSNPTQATIEIRGYGGVNISTGGDPSVATFYDGMYVPRAATTGSFTDVARIEVLKGPQGTLYGRNAAAGVVHVVPNRPGPENEAFIKTRIGNYSLFRAEAMGNLSLSENFFLRANVMSNQRDGYLTNLYPGERDGGEQDNLAARISALWEISSATDLQLSYDYDKVDNAPRAAVGLSEWSACPENPRCGSILNDVINGKESRDMWSLGAKLNHEISDQLSLKFTTGYRTFDTINRQDEDGTAEFDRYLDTDNIENSEISYTELQFNFVNERVNLIFGANYSKEDVHQEIPVNSNVDSVMRAVSTEIRREVVNGVNAQLEALGLPPVEEDEALFLLGQQLGLPFTPDMDHVWDPVTMAIFLGTQGIEVAPEDVVATGDFFYDLVQQSGFPGPFVGPSYAGTSWSEYYFNDGDFTNWGVYGDIDIKLNDRLNLLFGLRYSDDEKSFSWRNPGNSFAVNRPGTPDLIFPPDPAYPDARTGTLFANHSWDKLTGRAVARYQVSDDAQIFASYSTGYIAGGYDSLEPDTSDNPLQPEESENLELGLKGDFLDRRLRLQLSLFDMQVEGKRRTVDTRPPNTPQPIPRVITGDLDFQGVEIVVNWLVTDSVRLGFLTTVRDVENTWEPFYNSEQELVTETSTSSTDTDYTLTLGWQPDIGAGNLDMRIDYIFNENNADGPFAGFYEDRKELNARIAWASEDDKWMAALWGKNLLDQKLLGGISDISILFGTEFTSMSQPLTWGVELGYRF